MPTGNAAPTYFRSGSGSGSGGGGGWLDGGGSAAPSVDATGFQPTRLLPTSRVLLDDGLPAATVRARHRSSGLWLRLPAARCDTRCGFAAAYAEASDLYLCRGAATTTAGFALQSACDGRMLSANCGRRTWSPSPLRRRGGGEGAGGGGGGGSDELHLHTRSFCDAEVMELTDYCELRFASSGLYVSAPDLHHALHVSVLGGGGGGGGGGGSHSGGAAADGGVGLCLTRSRLDAPAWDLFLSHPPYRRRCRCCAVWYDARRLERCCGGGNDGGGAGRHSSWLLDPWASRDDEAQAVHTRGVGAAGGGGVGGGGAGGTLPASVLPSVFAYLGLSSVRAVVSVCRAWLEVVDGSTDPQLGGNREWGVARSLVAVGRTCAAEAVSLRGRASGGGGGRATACVLRHAAGVAFPNAKAEKTKKKATEENAVSPLRLETASAEGECVVALLCRRVRAGLMENGMPAEDEVVQETYVWRFYVCVYVE